MRLWVGLAVIAVPVALWLVLPPLASTPEDSEQTDSADASAPGRTDDDALRRLRAHLLTQPPVSTRSHEARLAHTRAWVAQHRPTNWPYAEIEARMLALQEAVFDGSEQSARWVMDASLQEIEMLRALDADGDGLVIDDELHSFTEIEALFERMDQHPYFVARFDGDGDGVLSDAEYARMNGLNGTSGVMAGLLERAALERWDADLDGVLTPAERSAGAHEITSRMKLFPDGHLEFVEDPAMVDPAEQQELLNRMADDWGAEVARTLEAHRSVYFDHLLTAPLTSAMRVETVSEDFWAQISMDPPEGPEPESFDADGDGVLNDTEHAAMVEATDGYLDRVTAWQAEQQARVKRLQFEQATAQSDRDGDGRMSAQEWDARLAGLLALRDQRLFRASYDLDADGRVGEAELSRLLDWYKSGSLRADANYDGLLDAQDLEQAIKVYQQQEP